MAKKRVRLNLSMKIALIFGLSTAVLFVILGVLITLQVRNTVVPLTEDMSMQIVEARAGEVGKWVEGHKKLISLMSRNSAIRGAQEEREAYLRSEHAAKNTEYETVFFLGMDGKGYTTEGDVVELGDREYFIEFTRGAEFVISNPLISRYTGNPTLVMGSEVRNPAGQRIGLMAVTISLDTVSVLTSQINVGETGYGWIADGTGLVVAHPREDFRMKFNLFRGREMGFTGYEAVAQKIVNGESGVAQIVNDQGIKSRNIFTPIPNTPNWSLGVTVPERELLAVATTIQNSLIIIIAIAVVIIIVLSLFIARSIVKPILSITKAIGLIAKGDLVLEEVPVEERNKISRRNDELGAIGKALSDMVESLEQITVSIVSASDEVSTGSQAISDTAQSMSQGATEQAASAEEVSSSIEEMSANIKQNTENAMQTEVMAKKAAEDAQEGGKAVLETVTAMREISGKISIIEEIARQTNMLALNAAIEAARAGEAGKGFAVVASEVRKLAERSQSAAAEINMLSSKSVEVAESAGQLIERIVPDIRKTAELVQEISAASREQSTGTEQITKAIIQLDKVIQSNASASEELASMAEELSTQAEELQGTVAFFRIKSHDKKKALLSPPGDVSHKETVKAMFSGPKAGVKKVLEKHIEPEDAKPAPKPAVKPRSAPTGITLKMSGGDAEDNDFEEF